MHTSSTDHANDLARDSSGNIVVTGSTGGTLFPGSGSAFMAKYNPAGSLLWGKQFGFGGIALSRWKTSG